MGVVLPTFNGGPKCRNFISLLTKLLRNRPQLHNVHNVPPLVRCRFAGFDSPYYLFIRHFVSILQSSSSAGVIVEPAVVSYNLEVKADVVADIANIAEFTKASDTQASYRLSLTPTTSS